MEHTVLVCKRKTFFARIFDIYFYVIISGYENRDRTREFKGKRTIEWGEEAHGKKRITNKKSEEEKDNPVKGWSSPSPQLIHSC